MNMPRSNLSPFSTAYFLELTAGQQSKQTFHGRNTVLFSLHQIIL